MSLTHQQAATLRARCQRWSRALARAVSAHGLPNSFGVVEIAEEYNLSKRDGYCFCPGKGRLPILAQYLREWWKLDIEIEYVRARFHVKQREAAPAVPA